MTHMLQCITKEGEILKDVSIDLSEAELIKAYQTMVLTRTLDTKMVALQRQGRIGFYLPSYEIHFYQFLDQTITHLPHSVVHSFHKPH